MIAQPSHVNASASANVAPLSLAAGAKQPVKEVSVSELARVQQEGQILLVDVRESNEWQQGFLPGAVHIKRSDIEAGVEAVASDRSAAIVCYCAGGHRSALAAASLQKLGYTNVASLRGGIKAWSAAGLPTTRPGSGAT